MVPYILLFLSDCVGVSRVNLFYFSALYSVLCRCSTLWAHLVGQIQRLFGPAGFCAEYISSYFLYPEGSRGWFYMSDYYYYYYVLHSYDIIAVFLLVCFSLIQQSEPRGLVTWWSHIVPILDYLICFSLSLSLFLFCYVCLFVCLSTPQTFSVCSPNDLRWLPFNRYPLYCKRRQTWLWFVEDLLLFYLSPGNLSAKESIAHC